MGQDEEAATPVARACFSRREQSRLWAVAHCAKVSDDVGKSQIEVAFDIFAEQPLGPDLVGDPGDLGPEVSGVVSAAAFARGAEGLAGITGRDDMNAAAPSAAVEGAQIVPNRRLAQGLVFHPRHESGCCVSFPLDISHSAIGWLCDVQAEIEAGIAGAEGNSAQFALRWAGGT